MLYSPVLTYLFGAQNFRWEKFEEGILVVDDSDVAGMTQTQLVQQSEVEDPKVDEDTNVKMKRATVIAGFSSVVSSDGPRK